MQRSNLIPCRRPSPTSIREQRRPDNLAMHDVSLRVLRLNLVTAAPRAYAAAIWCTPGLVGKVVVLTIIMAIRFGDGSSALAHGFFQTAMVPARSHMFAAELKLHNRGHGSPSFGSPRPGVLIHAPQAAAGLCWRLVCDRHPHRGAWPVVSAKFGDIESTL